MVNRMAEWIMKEETDMDGVGCYIKTGKVVRCKDCKYYYYADNRIPSERGWACANDGCYASQNDYCSWGERIDG